MIVDDGCEAAHAHGPELRVGAGFKPALAQQPQTVKLRNGKAIDRIRADTESNPAQAADEPDNISRPTGEGGFETRPYKPSPFVRCVTKEGLLDSRGICFAGLIKSAAGNNPGEVEKHAERCRPGSWCGRPPRTVRPR